MQCIATRMVGYILLSVMNNDVNEQKISMTVSNKSSYEWKQNVVCKVSSVVLDKPRDQAEIYLCYRGNCLIVETWTNFIFQRAHLDSNLARVIIRRYLEYLRF